MATFGDRFVGALRLDSRTYDEVEHDPTATGQAVAVVVLSSVANGIGSFGIMGIRGLVVGIITALIGWVVWALVTYVIGAKLMPEPQTRTDVPQLLRTIGFANAPGVFRVFGIVPILGYLVYLVVFVWMVMAVVIAVRQALDYTSTARAVLVVLIGVVFYFIIMVIVAAPFALVAR